jgi:prepilin-type N-terminal cleavage/methylation domain-containing protein
MGFTLVELLVVIAIIGVLVAMLLPAVQAAREAARRSSCQNNLRQVGIALQNYHDTNKRFPSVAYLTRPTGTPGQVGAFHHTWLTSILPFIEQDPLHKSINFNLPAFNQPVRSTTVKILHCPSDGANEDPFEMHNIAKTNYAGSEGYHWWTDAMFFDPAWGSPWNQLQGRGSYAGVFQIGKTNDMADIKDGTSNTVAVCEVDSHGWGGGPIWTMGTGQPNQPQWGPARAAFVWIGVHGHSVQPPFRAPDDSGAAAMDAWWVHSFTPPPGDPPAGDPKVVGPSYITAWGVNTEWPGAGSDHAGNIVQFARCDGSVGQVSNSTAWGVWMGMNGMRDRSIKGE